MVSKLITSNEKILANYSDVFDGTGWFPGPPYHIQVNPNVTPKQCPCQPIPIYFKESFKKAIVKMLQVGVLKPVYQATPWINSFLLAEGKDKLGNLKFRICLDPNNLSKTIVHELYHSKTPKGIAHLLAETCVITVCDSRKVYWHQQLDEASSLLTTCNTELGSFWHTVLPFGATVAGDVFWRKLNECFGKLKQVIIMADDTTVVGYIVIMTMPSLACYRQPRNATSN